MFFVDYQHPKLNDLWFAETEGIFTPEENGLYDFGVCVRGTAELFIDGERIVSNVKNQRPGSSFPGTGTVEETGSTYLNAGQSYRITVQWGCTRTSMMTKAGTVNFGHDGLRFGGCKRLDPAQEIEDAARLASGVDQVILFAGLSGEWETEGEDRTTMDLPPHSDELISRVLDANPNTVVVIQSGTPVTTPWIHKGKSVLQAWYGGNETGHGIADVIYGAVNPSAKLPLTFPKRVNDNPTYLNYRSEGGRVLHGEDVYVGYRFYETVQIEPLFPFGHSLSYTTFSLSNLQLREQPEKRLTVSCNLWNTGSCAGAEVVQVYVAPQGPTLVRRPMKESNGFCKKFL